MRSILIAMLVAFGVQSPTPKPTPAIGDLMLVINAMKDPKATNADRSKLIGKTFLGTVVIDAVRLDPNDRTAATVTATPVTGASDQSTTIRLRFTGTVDQQLEQVKPKQPVRVRATLTAFSSGSGSDIWAIFSDLVVLRAEKGPGLLFSKKWARPRL